MGIDYKKIQLIKLSFLNKEVFLEVLLKIILRGGKKKLSVEEWQLKKHFICAGESKNVYPVKGSQVPNTQTRKLQSSMKMTEFAILLCLKS